MTGWTDGRNGKRICEKGMDKGKEERGRKMKI
jgi:hypothetical protein